MPSRLLPAALAAACLLQLAVLSPAKAEVRRDTPYAIHSMVYTNAPQPYGELFVMRSDGSEVQQLTDNQWEDGTPSWQPTTTLHQ